MGFFTSTPPPPPPDKIIAPNRSQRAICWEGRDAFFSCLDAHGIIDPLKPGDKEKASKVCRKEEAIFEKGCVPSWVEYFKKRRVMEYNREQMLEKLKKEGAQTVGVSDPVGSAQVEKE